MVYTMSHITPNHKTLEERFNEEIRLVNCLVSQVGKLSAQLEKSKGELNSLSSKKYYIKAFLNSAILDKQKYLNTLNDIREEEETLKWYQLKQKRKARKEREWFLNEIELMNMRIEDLKAQAVAVELKMAELPRQIMEVELPNLKNHIQKLEVAISAYNKTKDVVEVTIGAEYPTLHLNEILLNEEGVIQVSPTFLELSPLSLKETYIVTENES